MWRHEDIYRVLFGGTDFATGDSSRMNTTCRGRPRRSRQWCAMRSADDPRCHPVGDLDVHLLGQTTVLSPEFDADEVWRTIHEHKVTCCSSR